MTLSRLQYCIKKTLAEEFSLPVWVVAEIGDLKVNSSSGHCYLELVEKGGTNGVPKAQMRAVAWRNVWGVLSAYFAGATGKQLVAGMKVMLSVSVTYHELYGLSLNIHDIDPLYTMGDLERQKQETIAKLKSDGVFDDNRNLELPFVIQRIAVVTSPTAAGYQDFLNELHSSGYFFRTALFEAVMQGNGAENSIVSALARVMDRCEEFDAIVFIRGGGSQSDLSFLNSYILCSHIAQYPLPVVTGLGHDKDQSIADMVAAVPLKTPTAVAGYLVSLAAEAEILLDNLANHLKESANSKMSGAAAKLQNLSALLQGRTVSFSREAGLRLERLAGELSRRSGGIVTQRRERLNAMHALLVERSARALAQARSRVAHGEQLLESRDPAQILKRGFAIVRRSGVAVTDAARLSCGEKIDIVLARGEIEALITDIKKDGKEER